MTDSTPNMYERSPEAQMPEWQTCISEEADRAAMVISRATLVPEIMIAASAIARVSGIELNAENLRREIETRASAALRATLEGLTTRAAELGLPEYSSHLTSLDGLFATPAEAPIEIIIAAPVVEEPPKPAVETKNDKVAIVEPRTRQPSQLKAERVAKPSDPDTKRLDLLQRMLGESAEKYVTHGEQTPEERVTAIERILARYLDFPKRSKLFKPEVTVDVMRRFLASELTSKRFGVDVEKKSDAFMDVKILNFVDKFKFEGVTREELLSLIFPDAETTEVLPPVAVIEPTESVVEAPAVVEVRTIDDAQESRREVAADAIAACVFGDRNVETSAKHVKYDQLWPELADETDDLRHWLRVGIGELRLSDEEALALRRHVGLESIREGDVLTGRVRTLLDRCWGDVLKRKGNNVSPDIASAMQTMFKYGMPASLMAQNTEQNQKGFTNPAAARQNMAQTLTTAFEAMFRVTRTRRR